MFTTYSWRCAGRADCYVSPSEDRLQQLFKISGPRKPPDWIGPTNLAFYWPLRWPAVGLEILALTASTSSVFSTEVDVGQSAHGTYSTGKMPLS